MKSLTKISLVAFYVSVLLFFLKYIIPDFLPAIDEFYFNIMWPLALMVYGVSKYYEDKQMEKGEQVKKESADL